MLFWVSKTGPLTNCVIFENFKYSRCVQVSRPNPGPEFQYPFPKSRHNIYCKKLTLVRVASAYLKKVIFLTDILTDRPLCTVYEKEIFCREKLTIFLSEIRRYSLDFYVRNTYTKSSTKFFLAKWEWNSKIHTIRPTGHVRTTLPKIQIKFSRSSLAYFFCIISFLLFSSIWGGGGGAS